MAKLSPEQQQMKAVFDFFDKYPDANPEMVKQRFGFELDPDFIRSMRESRQRSNAENERLQMVLSLIPGSGGAARKPLNVSSVPKKD